MALFYKLHYRENKTHPDATGYFAVIENKGTLSTQEVAEEIQRNCSLKRSDVLAVLSELGEVVRKSVLQSHAVKLDGLGVFRPGISSVRVTNPDDFDVRRNVRGLRLNFQPEQSMHNGRRTKNIFENAQLKKG